MVLQVDGRGNALLDFDDPNLPSLLAMPLLGFDGYDTEVGWGGVGCIHVFCGAAVTECDCWPCRCWAGLCSLSSCFVDV